MSPFTEVIVWCQPTATLRSNRFLTTGPALPVAERKREVKIAECIYNRAEEKANEINRDMSTGSEKKGIEASFKSMDTEEFLDIYFNRPIGYAWALFFKKLKGASLMW